MVGWDGGKDKQVPSLMPQNQRSRIPAPSLGQHFILFYLLLFFSLYFVITEVTLQVVILGSWARAPRGAPA